jgi:cysteine desulfuration protein SufE
MTAILCKGLHGTSPEEILALEADFVPRLIGAELVRQRSQTVYYVLGRMKAALTVWRNRRRAANTEPDHQS